MTEKEIRTYLLGLPNVEAHPHFDREAFRRKGKRIFATLHTGKGSLNVK